MAEDVTSRQVVPFLHGLATRCPPPALPSTVVARLDTTIAKLLDQLDVAFATLEPDPSRRPRRAEGASPERIAALEHRLGRALSPSCRAFLAISDGYAASEPDIIALYSTAQLQPGTAETAEAAAWQAADPDDEVARRGLVIGATIDGHVVLERGTKAGEHAVVVIDSESEHVRHASLTTYLRACLRAIQERGEARAKQAEADRRQAEHRASGTQFEVVRDVAFSLDGVWIITHGGDVGHLQVWDARRLGPAQDRARWAPFVRELAPSRSVAEPFEASLELGDDGASVRLGDMAWLIASGTAVPAERARYAIGRGRVVPRYDGGKLVPAEVDSPDGRSILRIEARTTTHRMRAGGASRTYPGHGPASFSPDSTLAVCTHRFQRRVGLRVWDLSLP